MREPSNFELKGSADSPGFGSIKPLCPGADNSVYSAGSDDKYRRIDNRKATALGGASVACMAVSALTFPHLALSASFFTAGLLCAQVSDILRSDG